MKMTTRIILALLAMAAAAITLSIAAQGDAPTATPDPALEEFIPTEQLPADSAVSFPVDI